MLKKIAKKFGLLNKRSEDGVLNVAADLMAIYKEMYPILIHFHKIQSLAPNAATLNNSGELTGDALVTDDNVDITVEYALEHFANKFREYVKSGNIKASAIFYHGHVYQSEYRPAQTAEKANAIVGNLENKSQSLVIIIPYYYNQGIWKYEEPEFIRVKANIFV